jgi:AcrR family transcriptional regulator
MPLQLYDKEKILDACLTVFAQHGYENTSVSMLAEAAGISKALIFHHFKSKRELYLSLLDQCFEKAKAILNVDNISKSQDFFETKEKLSVTKFGYYKKNPDLYKIVREAFYSTPNELRSDIEEKYGAMIAKKNKIEEQLFEKVPLREGVDRGQAFKLVRLALDYFDNKYLSEMLDNNDLDETYFQNFIDERNSYFDMIRYVIQK